MSPSDAYCAGCGTESHAVKGIPLRFAKAWREALERSLIWSEWCFLAQEPDNWPYGQVVSTVPPKWGGAFSARNMRQWLGASWEALRQAGFPLPDKDPWNPWIVGSGLKGYSEGVRLVGVATRAAQQQAKSEAVSDLRSEFGLFCLTRERVGAVLQRGRSETPATLSFPVTEIESATVNGTRLRVRHIGGAEVAAEWSADSDHGGLLLKAAVLAGALSGDAQERLQSTVMAGAIADARATDQLRSLSLGEALAQLAAVLERVGQGRALR